MCNKPLMRHPTIRQPGFDLPRQQWSLLNRFRTEQGHCGACRRKWQLTDTDLCPCGETQTMSDIVESCPLTKLNGGLSRLHSADEDAVSWLASYGSWNAYEKNKNAFIRAHACNRLNILLKYNVIQHYLGTMYLPVGIGSKQLRGSDFKHCMICYWACEVVIVFAVYTIYQFQFTIFINCLVRNVRCLCSVQY